MGEEGRRGRWVPEDCGSLSPVTSLSGKRQAVPGSPVSDLESDVSFPFASCRSLPEQPLILGTSGNWSSVLNAHQMGLKAGQRTNSLTDWCLLFLLSPPQVPHLAVQSLPRNPSLCFLPSGILSIFQTSFCTHAGH